MLYENYFNNRTMADIYCYEKETESHHISNWSTKENQENNFKQVTELLRPYDIDSLLDVGSGIGSIQSFLPQHIDYYGIDIVPWIVERAANPKIIEADIKTYTPGRTYDAVIALGSFNIGVQFSDVLISFERMYELCNKVMMVSISYMFPEEVEKLQDLGYDVITNPVSFANGYGDRYIISKTK